MNARELDALWPVVKYTPVHKIRSVEITEGPGPLPHGAYERAPRVIATLDDGGTLELFSFYANERSFKPEEFIGLTVEEARQLKFAPGHPPAATR